ncbi:hypothetical protein FB45DRAFT_82821 [Roridomyces roridus]|uniref:Uncharacterized protein n=1 Tax=Roridomyces roridus TaxID=1738132 RepID=A0AAD7BL15_9AGAR|nr:hypothetical protein FB45DRAFT_82821 [Roridomyces roridus]
MSSTPSEPFESALPIELEQRIFELAAYTDPLLVPTLMVVAWRVKQWVEPLRYRIVIYVWPDLAATGLNGHRSYPLLKDLRPNHLQGRVNRILSTHPTILKNSTRHLCLNQTPHRDLLHAASSVEDLWLVPDSFHSSLPELLGALTLKRLHCTPATLFSDQWQNASRNHFTHSLFSNVTHLQILLIRSIDAAVETRIGLASLPNLTHFAFTDDIFLPEGTTVLGTCQGLRVLVFKLTFTRFPPLPTELGVDSRFVQMVCAKGIKDWHMGALTGMDFWVRAEEFIAKRRSGEVDCLEYVIPGDESENLP